MQRWNMQPYVDYNHKWLPILRLKSVTRRQFFYRGQHLLSMCDVNVCVQFSEGFQCFLHGILAGRVYLVTRVGLLPCHLDLDPFDLAASIFMAVAQLVEKRSRLPIG